MIPYKSALETALPKTLEVRLEIAKAMQTLTGDQDERLRQRRAEIASIRCELEALRQHVGELWRDFPSLAWAELRREWPSLSSQLRKYGYNPNEPRVPAGNPDGGQWTSDGVQVAQNDDGRSKSDAIPPSRGEGHHWVPKGVYEKEPLRPETREVFENAISGPLADNSVNRWNTEHRAYNEAVQDAFNTFLQTNNITSEEMTPEQAQNFVDEVKASNDPRIYNLKMKILHQALRYIDIWSLGGGDEE